MPTLLPKLIGLFANLKIFFTGFDTSHIVVEFVTQDEILYDELWHGFKESLLESGCDGLSLDLIHQQEVVRVVCIHIAELEQIRKLPCKNKDKIGSTKNRTQSLKSLQVKTSKSNHPHAFLKSKFILEMVASKIRISVLVSSYSNL